MILRIRYAKDGYYRLEQRYLFLWKTVCKNSRGEATRYPSFIEADYHLRQIVKITNEFVSATFVYKEER